jgi:hypothetical protein
MIRDFWQGVATSRSPRSCSSFDSSLKFVAGNAERLKVRIIVQTAASTVNDVIHLQL